MGKNGSESNRPRQTDRGKGGVKRSLLTESRGVPISVTVEGANRHDMKLVRATCEQIVVKRPQPSVEQPQGMCLDKGYDYAEVRAMLMEFGFTAHIRSRGEEAQALKEEAEYKARMWVVERTLAWLNRFRRLKVRYERRADIHQAFLSLGCALTCWKRVQVAGELPVAISA